MATSRNISKSAAKPASSGVVNTANGDKLRKLIEQSGLTQTAVLDRLNEGQVRPIALSTLKAYLSDPSSKRHRACPDAVLQHAKAVLPA